MKIMQLERELGRKLTEEEKKRIREKFHHVEIENEEDEEEREEILVEA